MTAPAPGFKLSFAATRVVKASTELTPAQKLVWLELHALDRGEEGAWIGADGLARRLGTNRNALKALRDDLKAIGLVSVQQGRRGGRAAWLVRLPEGCIPPATRVDPEELDRLAAILDRHIRAKRVGAPSTHSSAEVGAGDAQSPDKVGAGSGIQHPLLEIRRVPTAPTSRTEFQNTVGAVDTHSCPTPTTPTSEVGEVGESQILQPEVGEAGLFAHANNQRREKSTAENSGLPRDGPPPAAVPAGPHPCLDCGADVAEPERLRCPACHGTHVRQGFAQIRAAVQTSAGGASAAGGLHE